MNRVQKFLRCNEINPQLQSHNDSSLEKSGLDIDIKNANFSYGGCHEETEESKDKKKNKKKDKVLPCEEKRPNKVNTVSE